VILGGEPSPFKGVALLTRGLSRDSPRVPARTRETARGYPATVTYTTRGLAPMQPKFVLQDANSPLFFSLWFCRMYVHWREQEHEASYEVVAR
jgi:hypothetical protein